MDAVWIKIAAMTVCVAVATIDQPHPIQLTGEEEAGLQCITPHYSDQGIRHTVSIAQSVTGLMGSPARALSLAVAANRFINRAAIVTGQYNFSLSCPSSHTVVLALLVKNNAAALEAPNPLTSFLPSCSH